jgi:hypothetical protein
VAVAFDFDDWSRNNYVLVPAVVYNGNRFHALGGGYMPAFPREMYFNPKVQLTMSNNPRLSVEPGKASKIELLTGNAATPAVCFFAPAQKHGFLLLTEQKTRFGNNGLSIEENAAQDEITFVVSAPGVRERAAEFGGFRASGDVAADWKPGDAVTLKFRVYSFPADGIPALLEKFMAVRKALTGPNQPRNLVPISKLSETIVPRFKRRWMTAPGGSYYACENSADDYVFKLYRATGDVRYAELIRDIQHAHVEATEMPGHPTCGTGDGASMEGIQPTDGEGKGAIGNLVHTQNAWTELGGLMMATELPGIYLQTDADKFFVFDHVEAKVVKRDATGVTLAVTNPTQYPARVTLFAESAAQAQQPLDYTTYLRWPRIELAARQSVTWRVDATGQPTTGRDRRKP